MKKLLLLIICSLLLTHQTFAQWSSDPAVNTAICTAVGGQETPVIVSDGSGGAIIAWWDYRGSDYDIYAQRINSAGVVQWTFDGVAVCTAANHQLYATIASDGSGGAIITWHEYRITGLAGQDIYAQRINANGEVQWTANGVAICTATGEQGYPTIVSDGSGGAIITWMDLRSGAEDIYAQRVNASGAVQWTTDGVAVCTYGEGQFYPIIVSDGSGGAIITWTDIRVSQWDHDIYSQRVNANGVVQWTANGIGVCTATDRQERPSMISDGSGGALITWDDARSGTANNIYVQHVNASGADQWTTGGVALSTASGLEIYPTIASDGAGGAIVTWQDDRNGVFDIYTQRINASGAVQWTADGVVICTATGDQIYPSILSDGSGGAFITWTDQRSGQWEYYYYAQRVNAIGIEQWTANGIVVSTVEGSQWGPLIISDGSSGAIITWENNLQDIYAQNVCANGNLGVCQALTFSIISTNVTCNGASDGMISIIQTGTQTPYTYSIDGINFQGSPDFIGLAGGTYTVTVMDGLNNTETGSAIISEPSAITLTPLATDASCNGVCDGTASVTADGGIPAYTYMWNDINGQTTQTATALCAGTYEVTVIDANACISNASVSIFEPAPTVVDITLNGSVLESNMPTGNEWYMVGDINLLGSAQTYTPTQPGDYYVLYYDGANCPSYSDTITIITVGVEGITTNSEITVYPNPTNSTIAFKGLNEKATANIMDATGRVVLATEVINNKVDVSSVANGVYVLRVETVNGVNNYRIIKQ